MRLRLAPPDSGTQLGILRLRMVGTIVSPSPLGGRADTAAQHRPDVGIAGRTLYLSGMGVTDASGDFLNPTDVSDDWFWGTWQYSSGIEMRVTRGSTGKWVPTPEAEPRGFFCARRVSG